MTPDQMALLRKAHSSLHAAKLLAGEHLYDFAVSRAYYTMFYVAEALLLGHGLSYSKHSAVLAAFGERLTKSGLVPPEFHKYLLDGGDSRRGIMILGLDSRRERLRNRSVEHKSS